MRIGGYLKFSLVDYPGKMAAVIFTQGCNFRCPFCHNPDLVVPERFQPSVPEEEVFTFLQHRRGMLQGVVISGGEPTLHKDLLFFLQRVRDLGFAIKLDTNGSRPDVLREVIARRLADYIAMDIKAPWAKYPQLAGVDCDIAGLQESVELILRSNVEHEFRTTLVKPYLNSGDFSELAAIGCRAQRYTLQQFVPRDHLLDPSLRDKENYTEQEMAQLQQQWGKEPSLPTSARV